MKFEAHVRDNLCVLLVTNHVKGRVVDSYEVPNIVSMTADPP